MKLAKLGYYGGDPKKVMRAPADDVLNILRFEVFQNDLTQAYEDLIKQEADDGN